MNTIEYEKLPIAFYLRNNVVEIANDLLGKFLFTYLDGQLTGAKIVETEAYNGRNDKACHAYHKRTPRTEIMYTLGGKAYVYLCYGIHHLFNVVTNAEGMADAVLIRAVEPVIGLDVMKTRRKMEVLEKLTSGPGILSVALGIKRTMTGVELNGDQIWIAELKGGVDKFEIETDVRIGVDYAEEDALLPWRFYIRENKYVSRIKKKTRLEPGF
ncbi:MAG: DNA-3-methyladenine glycosylase [Cyclobacteriaceae bacterium]|jgi:DNA-3-methyladenine glycosylase